MGLALDFEKEKLIIGVIYHDRAVLDAALAELTAEFGPVDDSTEEFSFSRDFSSYYDEELDGEGLRRIYSFERMVDAERQADIKTFTNALEKKYSEDGRRKINLDPGFINSGRLMLATTKQSGFRIPLKDGIYTELTLFYARGEFHDLPWTYRDYSSERVKRFLVRVRKKYLAERKVSRA
ncbi:MAG: DUF4416 family protein [Clostridia bacterium]|nr:DUF4416 family protein [Clostridia bacterium]